MAVTLLCGFDPAQERNAFLAVRNRLEGVLSASRVRQGSQGTAGDLFVIEKNVLVLEVTLAEEVSPSQQAAIIRTLTNLVGRPESGITTPWRVIPENTEGLQRQYSV